MTVIHMNQWATRNGIGQDQQNLVHKYFLKPSGVTLSLLDFSKVVCELGQKVTPHALANENSDFTSI